MRHCQFFGYPSHGPVQPNLHLMKYTYSPIVITILKIICTYIFGNYGLIRNSVKINDDNSIRRNEQ